MAVVPEAAWRHVQWPDGAVIAMTVGVAFEAFERQSQVQLAARPGELDRFSLSYAEYGARIGVWRLLELFDEEAVHASFTVSGLAAQRYPETVRTIADAGHDLIGHGWVNDRFMPNETEAEERAIIRETLDAIHQASGVRPTGWSSPASSDSERTVSLLLDEGLTWSGDDASDDLPYVQDVAGRPFAVLPKVNMGANDLLHWIWPRNPPAVFLDSFRDTFDCLYSESTRGRPKWADAMLHCHMAGRPTFIPTVRAMLQHVKAHEQVWWTRKSDVAAWTLRQDFRR